MRLGTALAAGAVFGAALHKGGVSNPEVIRAQLRFTDFTMLKVFLSASATSMATLTAMWLCPKSRDAVEETSEQARARPVVGCGGGRHPSPRHVPPKAVDVTRGSCMRARA